MHYPFIVIVARKAILAGLCLAMLLREWILLQTNLRVFLRCLHVSDYLELLRRPKTKLNLAD